MTLGRGWRESIDNKHRHTHRQIAVAQQNTQTRETAATPYYNSVWTGSNSHLSPNKIKHNITCWLCSEIVKTEFEIHFIYISLSISLLLSLCICFFVSLTFFLHLALEPRGAPLVGPLVFRLACCARKCAVRCDAMRCVCVCESVFAAAAVAVYLVPLFCASRCR